MKKIIPYLTCLIFRRDAGRKEMSLFTGLMKLDGDLHDPDVSGIDPALVKRGNRSNDCQNPASACG